MTCDDYRAHVLTSLDEPDAHAWSTDSHPAACPACRAWLARFREGLDFAAASLPPGWAAGVGARTAGGACDRARMLVASAADGPIPTVDAALLQGHLGACHDCRVFEADWAAIGVALPAMAIVEPGPAFTASVLAATSRRPPRARWAAQTAAAWRALVSRPRFAWEAAYVCTLCWLLVFGNPIRAFDWTTARLGAVSEAAASSAATLSALRPAAPAAPAWWPSMDDVARLGEGWVDSRQVEAAVAAARQQVADWLDARVSDLFGLWHAIWTEVASWFAGEPTDGRLR